MRSVLVLITTAIGCVSTSSGDTGSATSAGTATTGTATGTTPITGTTSTGPVTNPFALFDARMAHSDDGRGATSGKYGQVAWWDGQDWRIGATESGYDDSLNDIVFDGTRFVGVGGEPDVGGIGADYHVWESTDGAWWTQNGTVMDVKPARLLYGNGVYLILRTRDSAILRSTDRVTWTTEETQAIDLTGDFGAGVFVVSVDPGSVRTSSDGQSWTDHPTGLTAAFQRVRHTDNGFAAYIYDNKGTWYDYDDDEHYFAQSPDGMAWTSTLMTGAAWLWDIVWFDGAWYATPGMNTLFTSTDGATWTEAGEFTGLFDVHVHDGTLFATGHYIHTSTDGVTWTQQPFLP